MKNFINIFLTLVILSTSYVCDINALNILKPQKTLYIPIDAFNTDLAVNNGTLYYMIKIKDKNAAYSEFRTDIYAKNIMSENKAVKVYSSVDIIAHSFKKLYDDTLYVPAHIGGGIMGSDILILLNNTELAEAKFFSYGSVEYDDTKKSFIFESDPYFMVDIEEKDYYYIHYNDIINYGYRKKFDFSPKFSPIRNNITYMLKLPYREKYENYGIVSIDKTSKEENILIKNVDNMTMADDKIYYWRFDKSKIGSSYFLYSYSLKDKTTELICTHKDPSFDIFPLENKIFFMGNKEYVKEDIDDEKLYSTLFMAENNNCTPLYSDMKRVASNGKILAVLFENKYNSEVKLIDENGKEFAKLIVPVNQADISISANELIVWSYQDRAVRYYNIK